MNIQHIIWDWNGTLQDDVQAAVNGINALLEPRGLPLCDVARHRRHFRFPVRKYYEALGFDLEREDWQAMAQRFHDVFEADTSARLRPEAIPVLDAFRKGGVGMSVLSACEQGILERTLRRYGIYDYFDVVSGLDNLSAHSKVDNGIKLLQTLNLPRQSIWMVGDTEHDYEVAQALGISCLLLTDGYQDVERLRQCPCPKINNLNEIGVYLC